MKNSKAQEALANATGLVGIAKIACAKYFYAPYKSKHWHEKNACVDEKAMGNLQQAVTLLNSVIVAGSVGKAFTYVKYLPGTGNHYSFGVGVMDQDNWCVGFRATPVMF